MRQQQSAAIVLLSGGQDSATVLHWTMENYQKVIVMSFDYGQRHHIELDSAKRIAIALGLQQHVLQLGDVFPTTNALRSKINIEVSPDGLPNTFVPGRNFIFLTTAAAFGKTRGISYIIGGMCQTDYSGYPDCRRESIDALESALRLGLEMPNLEIITPLMDLSKKQTVELGYNLGESCLKSLALSHTCYLGIFPPCGACPACKIRAKGFSDAGLKDPLFDTNLNPRWGYVNAE